MRAPGLILTTVLLCAPVPSYGLPTSKLTLLQYQYGTDVAECNVNLSNGIRIEFDGVFANDGEQTYFNEIVIFRIPTKELFGISTLVTVSGGGELHHAKVAKVEPGYVYVAMGHEFLNQFWGDDVTYEIKNIGKGAYTKSVYFDLPHPTLPARIAISKGRTCQTEALNAD